MAWIIGILIALLIAGRSIASFAIEYEWWKELGQLSTWRSILLYSFVPQFLAGFVAFAVLWTAHARGMKLAGTGLREYSTYAKLASLALLVVSLILGAATINGWTFARYFGAKEVRAATAGEYRDPVFGHGLSFYLFDLPFYSQLLAYGIVLALATAVVYWATARGWMIRQQAHDFRDGFEINIQHFRFGGPEPLLLRIVIAVFLLGLAGQSFLARYEYLNSQHGFMVGADYVNTHIGIPLQWLSVAAFVLAAILVASGRWKWALAPVLLLILKAVVPPIVSTVHVKPNELTLQRPFIQHHIQATRAAFGFDRRLKEVNHPGISEAPIDAVKNKPLLENVRLWDWRAFHDTVTQLQALRQYYVFADTDVDRYNIDGQLKQVMVAPRELDIRQLPDARANWINGHFIYTHGYGLVMADATEISSNGQPVFLAKDAPPSLLTKSLTLKRPEIYYGESTHEPVFVRTDQPEFNYPAGSDNVHTRYEGKGGIGIGNFGMRLAAALRYADRNLLLTNLLNGDSRMLINRDVRERVSKLAGFLHWDTDPYLILNDEGRLIWMIDGYTTSDSHPYAARVRMANMGVFNYIRNSVKATVDAYDGTVTMYIYDETDPIILAWQSMFPALFRSASEMPNGIRVHVRYPETFFQAQSEVYRAFHMQVAEAFYNKEDIWDVAKNAYSQTQQAEGTAATYVVATLPGESKPEFLLLQSFTPRSKDNLIGVMAARCDPDHYGELVVLQLSKQSLIYGPLQIDARIGSDQNIAKDLSLWNQQGSQVLRGQMLVLPIDNTFLYVEPIYIQSSQARMPQLKKVVLAMGNTLIYRDTYEEALSELTGAAPAPAASTSTEPAQTTTTTTAAPASTAPSPQAGGNIEQVRQHLRRYRELSSQGRWSEAGRELEALEKLVGR